MPSWCFFLYHILALNWIVCHFNLYLNQRLCFSSEVLWRETCTNVCVFSYTEAAEKLFDLVDSFAESAKRKAAVWPLLIILLILCPEITHTISKDTVEESKANKVDRKKVTNARCFQTDADAINPPASLLCCFCRNCFWIICAKLYPAREGANSWWRAPPSPALSSAKLRPTSTGRITQPFSFWSSLSSWISRSRWLFPLSCIELFIYVMQELCPILQDKWGRVGKNQIKMRFPW